MVEAPSLVLAFAAGFVSFLSPCCLPLVPGYLAAVCGVAPGEQRARVDAGVLWRDMRPRALIARARSGGPVVAGAAFAIAWTPCVGPTLGAILGLASTSAGTAQGGLLLAVYSAGLAIPFLLSAIAFTSASRAFRWLGRHHAAIQLSGGTVLIAMGVLVLSGELFRLNIEAQRLLDGLGLKFLTGI